MILDPKLQKLFKEYLSASHENTFIEPFFDDSRVLFKSENIEFKKGKSFVCKKEDVWKPDKIHNKKGINVSNCYFQIRKLNNCYLLINRYQSDFRLIHGLRSAVDKTSTIIWTSDDGLSFNSENRFIISDEHVDNHNTFFINQECPEEKENKIMLFKGRGYGIKKSDDEGKFKYYKDTGLKLQFFENELQNFSNQSLVVKPSHMPTNNFWSGDLFDSLNSINYFNKRYFVHARVNRINGLRTPDAHEANSKRETDTDYFYRNRAVKLLVYDEKLTHTQIYSKHKASYCSFYKSYPYQNRKKPLTEINIVDIYVGNVFNYPDTTYNLSCPVGLCYKKGGDPEERKFFNIGLFFTSKKEQLKFYLMGGNKKVIPELEREQYYFINGMVENKENTHYNFYAVTKNQINCFEIPKDRFNCITAVNDRGYIIMKPKPTFKNLNINFETFEDDGFIYCQLMDDEYNVVAECDKLKGDFMNYQVEFIPKNKRVSLGFIYEYKLKIVLNKACLFSYKLT
jgi:hypothetical protein